MTDEITVDTGDGVTYTVGVLEDVHMGRHRFTLSSHNIGNEHLPLWYHSEEGIIKIMDLLAQALCEMRDREKSR